MQKKKNIEPSARRYFDRLKRKKKKKAVLLWRTLILWGVIDTLINKRNGLCPKEPKQCGLRPLQNKSKRASL